MRILVEETKVVDIGDGRSVLVEPPGYDECDDAIGVLLIEAGAATENKTSTRKGSDDGSPSR